ncbi:hypothetical protein Pmani_022725 [Petrolisthes manimaculis]|uniref:Uncharacterized protein n=1 Tax=Petrolisthes manimaculis TaxID=1843537 RepID=A0AAE1PBK0_9EUCA|nr:hypothetical protein Pmani_022725 [Petrolisthes manimaculis]
MFCCSVGNRSPPLELFGVEQPTSCCLHHSRFGLVTTMEDFSTLHLTSPPSSLTDGLLAPRVSTPPVPRPRKTPSSPLALTSTPKTSSTPRHPTAPIPVSVRHLPSAPHASNGYERHHNSKGNRSQYGMQRSPSLDSATQLPLSPITQHRTNQSDSESEGESSPPCHRRSIPRLTFSPHPHPRPHRKPPHQHSHSLPATPRVNGGSHHHSQHQSPHNGSCITGASPSPLPCLQNPQDVASPSTSHYVTCPAGVSHLENSVFTPGECQAISAIDYSSLPLPDESQDPGCCTSHISRHLSEPCIPQARRCSPGRAPRMRSNRGTGQRSSRESVAMDNIRESGHSEGEGEGPGIEEGTRGTLEVQWRFIQTLVAELNATKTGHRRLMAELHQARMEIQMLRAALDAYSDAGLHPGSITEMVNQIHAAQKVRDEAMMARIKLANEERDAALTHSRTMMDKLNLSPHSHESQHFTTPSTASLEFTSAAELEQQQQQQQQQSSGSSSTTSPHRHHRYQRHTIEAASPPTNHSTNTHQLTALEEEVRTLRLAATAAAATTASTTPTNTATTTTTTTGSQHVQQEGGGGQGGNSYQGVVRSCTQCVECGYGKQGGEGAAKGQLEEQCARLECLAAALRQKMTGFSMGQPGSKVTLVDLALHHHHHNNNNSNTNHNHRGASTSSEGDPRDSLSSLESVETASASSWRRGEVSAPPTCNQSLSSSNPPPALHSSCLFHHQGLSQSSPLHSIQQPNTIPGSSPGSSPLHYQTSSTPSSSPHHYHNNKGNDKDQRNIPGVTIVGPITEL